jgi:tetratricopeptide (TPR) repeat protein
LKPVRIFRRNKEESLGIFKPGSRNKHQSEAMLTLKEQAERYEQRGEYYKAIQAYESLLSEEKDRAAVFNALGDLYEKLGDVALAFDNYESAIAEYARHHQFRNAIGVARKVLRAHKDRVEMYKRLADLYAQEGRVGDAIQALNQYAEHTKSAQSAQVLEEIKETIAGLKDKSLLVQGAVDLGREEESGIFLPPIDDSYKPRPRPAPAPRAGEEVGEKEEQEAEEEAEVDEARRIEEERLVRELEQEILSEQNEEQGNPGKAVRSGHGD